MQVFQKARINLYTFKSSLKKKQSLSTFVMEKSSKTIQNQLGGLWIFDRGEHFEDALKEMGKLIYVSIITLRTYS